LRFTSIVPAIRPQAAGSPNYEPAAAEKAKIARRGVVAPLTLVQSSIAPIGIGILRESTPLRGHSDFLSILRLHLQ